MPTCAEPLIYPVEGPLRDSQDGGELNLVIAMPFTRQADGTWRYSRRRRKFSDRGVPFKPRRLADDFMPINIRFQRHEILIKALEAQPVSAEEAKVYLNELERGLVFTAVAQRVVDPPVAVICRCGCHVIVTERVAEQAARSKTRIIVAAPRDTSS